LTFRSVGSLSVVYRVKTGEDAVKAALSILKDYYAVLSETKKNSLEGLQNGE